MGNPITFTHFPSVPLAKKAAVPHCDVKHHFRQPRNHTVPCLCIFHATSLNHARISPESIPLLFRIILVSVLNIFPMKPTSTTGVTFDF